KSLGIHPRRLSVAEVLFEDWLAQLSTAFEAQSAKYFAALFEVDGYWRDILSFSWERPTFSGHKAIADGFAATVPQARPRNLRIASNRTSPRFARRSGKDVIEAWFDFDTATGPGAGFVRLIYCNDQIDCDNSVQPR